MTDFSKYGNLFGVCDTDVHIAHCPNSDEIETFAGSGFKTAK